ncbi:nucleotidyltransferase family protein [Mitsuaria sp. WAJ17]|uniref:nucleotidyltransferase family protein n=1 Tax=Mitsuaria sp. WAJ17 TaxID=2761452 RepID=UPI001600246E|nr:nucleotidyltransferase family protein [Mitsuaria sp. WAJ17]MBB2486576.1 nucleotidyltransferase family protein [Mitsuaria sp. WAJ17]
MQAEDTLRAWLQDSGWLMTALRSARALGLGTWCVGAGAVRNVVWERLHGRRLLAEQLADIDLAHHSPLRGGADDDARLTRQLRQTSRLPWEVVNQAFVHRWPGARPGMRAHADLAAALASWPETATAVGAWLDAEDGLHLVAPHGVEDLMAGVLRPSPGVDAQLFARRLQEKGFLTRWPGLRQAARG